MVAKSGDKLLRDDAIDSLKSNLLPLSLIMTPNVPEAEVLLGRKINNRHEMEQAAWDLSELGPDAVLLKGGHFEGKESPDCLVSKSDTLNWLEAKRIDTPNTHGTGCTLSSAITAYLASGKDLYTAVTKAKKYISAAIEAGRDYRTGKGHGPVLHFYRWWNLD